MILGIDPGRRGGLARYDWRTGAVEVWGVSDACDATGSACPRRIVELVRVAAAGCTATIIERVGGRPGQGAPAAWVFGEVTGMLRAAVAATGLPEHGAYPQAWKARLVAGTTKAAAIARASQLMPAGANLWARAADDGLAEAALVAYYGAHCRGLDGCQGDPPPRPRRRLTPEAIDAAILGKCR